MKRFLLFAGSRYYPSGGWGDFLGDFESAREARGEFKRLYREQTKLSSDAWYEVVDTVTMKKVIDRRLIGDRYESIVALMRS